MFRWFLLSFPITIYLNVFRIVLNINSIQFIFNSVWNLCLYVVQGQLRERRKRSEKCNCLYFLLQQCIVQFISIKEYKNWIIDINFERSISALASYNNIYFLFIVASTNSKFIQNHSHLSKVKYNRERRIKLRNKLTQRRITK